jgi:hypothetical protein
MKPADCLEMDVILSDDAAADEGKLQVDDESFFEKKEEKKGKLSPAASALPDKHEMADEGRDNRIDPESSQPPCPMYAELVGVMERAAGRLQLPWMLVGGEIDRDESVFSPVIEPPAQVSLSFLPDLILRSRGHGRTHILPVSTNISGLVSLMLRG